MARQSLKADPLGDATTYHRECTAMLVEEHQRLTEEFTQKRNECEALETRMAQIQADYTRLQAALELLEGRPTAGNGQDTHVVSEPSTPHLVAIDPPPRAFVDNEAWAARDVVGVPSLVDPEEEPPPEAA